MIGNLKPSQFAKKPDNLIVAKVNSFKVSFFSPQETAPDLPGFARGDLSVVPFIFGEMNSPYHL